MCVVYNSFLIFLAFHSIEARSVELSTDDQNTHKQSGDWITDALDGVRQKLNQPLNTNRAKNIIFFLGDGMSLTTVTAARIRQGQLLNKCGEEHVLPFEKFPASGYSKTYSANQQIADSGSTATAYLCGVKANYYTIGVTAKVKLNDCIAANDPSNRPSSILQWAQDSGKATGIVTTARITDASPAGGYAHVANRIMESDGDMLNANMNPLTCGSDIAKQLVREYPGKNIKVLMGGGIRKFLPKNTTDQFGNPGSRLDTDLIEEWKNDKLQKNIKSQFITTKDQLLSVDTSNIDYLLGLFSNSNMHYHLQNVHTEPTLEQMTNTAIKILQKEPNGFFLFVEGALIDKAHHMNQARYAIDETVEFAKAVQAAIELTNEEDTLIVVTSDHSQPLVMNGYAKIGNDILGITSTEFNNDDIRKPNTTLNFKMRHFTLNYGNGPGFGVNVESDLANNTDICGSTNKFVVSYQQPGVAVNPGEHTYPGRSCFCI